VWETLAVTQQRDPLDLFAELVAKVDVFFARVYAKHSTDMQCDKGCSDCCSDRLSITLLEAAALARTIGAMPEAQRQDLASHASRKDVSACAALANDGSCMVYEARPLICRSHGVAIRYGRELDDGDKTDAALRLPVVAACFKNFTGDGGVDAVATEDVLDQTTVSATLGALDAAFADECGVPRGTRIDLAQLVINPGDFFDIESF